MPKRSGAAAHDVEFRRLYLIAKAVLEGDPTIDNFEWCERIKDQLVRSRLGYPEKPEAIHDAMRAVESRVPRPAPQLHPTPPPVPRSEPKAPPPPDGLALRDAIQAQLAAIVQGKAMPSAAPGATEAQLDAWRRAQLANRQPTYCRTAKGWALIRRPEVEP